VRNFSGKASREKISREIFSRAVAPVFPGMVSGEKIQPLFPAESHFSRCFATFRKQNETTGKPELPIRKVRQTCAQAYVRE
jgi:hypothetical protein